MSGLPSGGRALLEPEHNTGLIPKVALVVIASRERIAETGEHVVELDGPDCDKASDWNVDAASDDEIKRIVAGRSRCIESAIHSASLNQVSVHVRVSAAKHGFDEGLKVMEANLEFRADIVK